MRNRGELAEGWYDPDTLQKARSSSHHRASPPIRDRTRSPEPKARTRERGSPNTEFGRLSEEEEEEEDEDDEDDGFHGPSLPQQQRTHTSHQKSGPTIPRTDDLQIQRELIRSTHDSEKSHSRTLHREAITSHKSELKHIEEEVAPRAEPGTHERRMEKRQERAAANRSFARGGSPVDAMGDDELMGGGGGGGGGGGDSLEAMKKEREKETRKKNDRELRREEILRARVAEREERMEAYRRKEDETMSVLKALAKQRFG